MRNLSGSGINTIKDEDSFEVNGDLGMDDAIESVVVGAFFEGYPNRSALALEEIDDRPGLVSRIASPTRLP